MSPILDDELDEAQRWSPAGLAVRPGKETSPRWYAGKGMIRLLVTNALYGYSLASFYLLPKHLAVTFAATPAQIGRVSGALSVASMLCFPVLGPAIRRLGHRRASIAGLAGLSACAAVFPLLAGAGGAMLVVRALQGLAASLFFTAGLAMVSATAPKDKLGHAMGLVGSASLAMAAVAPAVGEIVADHFGFAPVFLLAAFAALAGAWMARDLPDGGYEAPAPVGGADVRERLPLFAVMVIVGAGFNVVMAFLPPFALERGFPAVRAFFISYTLAALAIRLFCGAILARFGSAWSAAAGIVGYGLVIACLGMFGPEHRALWGFAFGLAHGLLFPALMALVFDGVSPAARGTLAALSNSLMHAGMMAVFGLGALAGIAGFPSVFALTGGIVVLSAWLLGRR